MRISGIYKIQSTIKQERCYIGSAVNISMRWFHHLSELRNNKHSNKKLQNHFNKHGESDLQFSVLLGCEKEDLIKTEQYFLDSYKPYFNINPIANSRLGAKCSDEVCKKARERMMGKKLHLGCKNTEEFKIRMKVVHKGKHPQRIGDVSTEAFEKNRVRQIGNTFALGYRHSDEAIKKISLASKRMWIKRKLVS